VIDQLPHELGEPKNKCSPLLKWPGGKRLLLKSIVSHLPRTFGRYYEPFLGGGALFFALRPQNAVLSDNNPELINCYIQVRDHPKKVIASLKELKNSEEAYYRIRAQVPSGQIGKAARLIYLTTLAFNGIHRLNLKGEFNVPYGYKTHLQPCDPVKITRISKTLSFAQLVCADFGQAVKTATYGDLIYFDPPYTVVHQNNGFLKYNDKIFSWDDQIRLADLARELAKRGCHVLVSNADNPFLKDLYSGFKVQEIKRASVIAASGKFRRCISECIFHNIG